jgi:zinc transporter ZupT
MADGTLTYAVWALALGAVSAVSLPLGSFVGLNVRFSPRCIAICAAFGAGALVAALSVELVAPTAFAIAEPNRAETALAEFTALMIGGVLGGLLDAGGVRDATVPHPAP